MHSEKAHARCDCWLDTTCELAGKIHDGKNGRIYMRRGYLHPKLGHFLTSDQRYQEGYGSTCSDILDYCQLGNLSR